MSNGGGQGPKVLEPALSRVMGDSAYERIRNDIVAGQLMPNERLVEADLTESLQVGRLAVRTALTRLEQEGLVVRERNRGARVRRVSEAEAVEILQVRAVLEAFAAAQAALNATDDEIAQMRATHDEMSKWLKAHEMLAFSESNERLHGYIIAAARHSVAAQMIANLRAQIVRFQFRTVLVPGRPKVSLAEHKVIVNAIANRDPDAAAAAMREHVSHVVKVLHDTAEARLQRHD